MYLEAIKLEQKKIFDSLNKFPEFYLVGGTALALQIGHRISVDFDLFFDNDIPSGLLRKVRRVFNGSQVKVELDHSEQLIVKIDGIKIDFVRYKFPIILGTIKFHGINLVQVPEIAVMKAHTLSYRGTFKDYVDFYFILKEKHTTLENIKKIAEKKYKEDFNFRLFLEQLLYLEDIKPEEIEFLKEKATKEEMRKFFEKEIKKIKF